MRVLDLFCGCGGFSTGFLKADYEVKYGIDFWKGCKETYEYNHPDTEFILEDIQTLDPNDFIFYGALSNQYKQVGNAVPPLMAYRLAEVLYKKRDMQGDSLLV
jgi:DNA (cytosine-5)-methyltransferase 1